MIVNSISASHAMAVKPRVFTPLAAATMADLQAQLNRFQHISNTLRPHRALNRATPAAAYAATPKARPATTTVEDSSHYRLRCYDRTDSHGKISFRRAGRMHHLGVGASNAHRRALAIADQTTVTVIDLSAGEILSTHTIEPDRSYWRNQQNAPADGQGVTNGPTHLSHMTRLITTVGPVVTGCTT
jgi:hypothetical protein